MELVESGWHGVGSIDRAAGAGFLSSQSSFTRNGGFPLHRVKLTLIRIKINISYELKGFHSEIRSGYIVHLVSRLCA